MLKPDKVYFNFGTRSNVNTTRAIQLEYRKAIRADIISTGGKIISHFNIQTESHCYRHVLPASDWAGIGV